MDPFQILGLMLMQIAMFAAKSFLASFCFVLGAAVAGKRVMQAIAKAQK